jgi:hypothetical protein
LHHGLNLQADIYNIKMATTPRKPILISGAGLSSLLLAQSLLHAAIPFLIFERDSSISFRAQGYRLRLSTEGLDAIKSVLEPEKFQKFWDKCGKTGGVGFSTIDAKTGPVTSGSTTSTAKSDIITENANSGGPQEKPTPTGGIIVGIARGEMRKEFLVSTRPRYPNLVKE